jgi:hypothetical protein
MLSTAAILAVGLMIGLIEVPALLKRRERKDLWVFSVLLLAGIGLSIAVSLNIEIPTPLLWIKKIYEPIVKVF